MDGKSDWMAYGLPVEGEDGPFVGEQLSGPATCDVTLTVGDARRQLKRSGTETLVLVHADGMAVGEVDADSLEGHADDVSLLEVFRPVPSTIRPSVTVDSVAEAGGGRRLVTSSDGRLLGQTTIPEREHEHAHGEESPVDMERYERELTDVMKGLEEHFGDHDPSDAEVRAFLHDRLVAEGRTPDDAERFLDQLEGDNPPPDH